MQKETKYMHSRHVEIRLAKCTKNRLEDFPNDVLVQVCCWAEVFYMIIMKTIMKILYLHFPKHS